MERSTDAETRAVSLIYDVGMFNGDDTAYYLEKGFHVVGIEANPRLITQLTQRFSAECRDRDRRGGPVVHRWRDCTPHSKISPPSFRDSSNLCLLLADFRLRNQSVVIKWAGRTPSGGNHE
jgi:hypothetical protein